MPKGLGSSSPEQGPSSIPHPEKSLLEIPSLFKTLANRHLFSLELLHHLKPKLTKPAEGIWMMPEGGSRKQPALRQRYPSAAALEVFPEGMGEVEALAGGSWERNQLMCWHSPVPPRIGVGHVCVCVYLGALTHRQEFPLVSCCSRRISEQ